MSGASPGSLRAGISLATSWANLMPARFETAVIAVDADMLGQCLGGAAKLDSDITQHGRMVGFEAQQPIQVLLGLHAAFGGKGSDHVERRTPSRGIKRAPQGLAIDGPPPHPAPPSCSRNRAKQVVALALGLVPMQLVLALPKTAEARPGSRPHRG